MPVKIQNSKDALLNKISSDVNNVIQDFLKKNNDFVSEESDEWTRKTILIFKVTTSEHKKKCLFRTQLVKETIKTHVCSIRYGTYTPMFSIDIYSKASEFDEKAKELSAMFPDTYAVYTSVAEYDSSLEEEEEEEEEEKKKEST